MPGPGNKKSKKKATKPASANTQSDAHRPVESLLLDIDHAYEWHVVANIICDAFGLPDLSTRSGLKRAHSDFDSIYQRLHTGYEQHKNNLKYIGGVVAIWAKMCNDALLRDKLFKKGILAKTTPLLEHPETAQLGIRSLASMTHLGGIEIKTMIAKESPKVVKLLEDYPEDHKLAELAIATLSHIVAAVTDKEKPDQQLMKKIDIPHLLDVVISVVKKEWATPYLLSHAHGLVASMTFSCSKLVRASPSMGFLLAFLRSEDIGIRGTSIRGIARLVIKDSVTENVSLDPMKMIQACGGRWPDEVADALMNYGMAKTDCVMTLQGMRDFQRAMVDVVQDHNLYKLGKKQAELIMSTEFSISEGTWETEDKHGRRGGASGLGLPFTMWSDSLPHCAKAIRAKKIPGELDLADVIDCKYFLMKRNSPQAISVAKSAIERNPDFAYFYYVIALASSDSSTGLRFAKQGVKCKTSMTPFIKHGLLHLGVTHATDLAMSTLGTSTPGDQAWKQAIGFLRSAYDDAGQYIKLAPPDQRQMKTVIYWYIVLTPVVKGPDLDLSLSALKPYFDKLRVAEASSRHTGLTIQDTQPRLMYRILVDHYASAYKEWSTVVRRYDDLNGALNVDVNASAGPVDELERWLEDVEGNTQSHEMSLGIHPRFGGGGAQLYRCVNCGNPSAVLRKCSRCDKARYCDSECQKAHWSEHKLVCSIRS